MKLSKTTLIILSILLVSIASAAYYSGVSYDYNSVAYEGGYESVTISGTINDMDQHPCSASGYPDITYELWEDDVLIDDLIARYEDYLVNYPAKQSIAFSHTFNNIRMSDWDDGGDVELVDVDEGVVKLRLQGACVGCPMSAMTLQNGIERLLKEQIPEVKQVIAV